MILYLCVTMDEFELPLAVADSTIELAQMCDVKTDTIRTLLARAKKEGRIFRYRKIEVPDNDDELWEGGNWND